MTTRPPHGGRDELVYVYAVGRDTPALDAAAARAGTAGVAGAPVRVVRSAGLGALVAPVPADRYGEDGFRAQLDDLDALERTARAHHAVVAAAFAAGTVLPMRMATVYRDDGRVAAMLADRAAEFGDHLARLDGRLEWGVKVHTDPERARRAAAPAPEPVAAGPGRAYLQRRRAQRDDQRTARQGAQALAGLAVERAARFAEAHVGHRPQQGAFSPDSGENVANLAFLVPAEHGEAFRAALRELDEAAAAGTAPAARVEVTGPWAPYSFATPGPGEGDTHGR